MLARIGFVLLPAVFLGGLGLALGPLGGLFLFGVAVLVGLEMTEPRADRGEKR